MEAEFTPIIRDIIVDPPQEELIFEPVINCHIGCPEHHLIDNQRESTLEQISWAFFKWNSNQSSNWRFVISAKIFWPGLISIVSSSSIFNWDGQPRCTTKSNKSTNCWFVRVGIWEFLGRPSTTIDILPCRKLNSSVTTCSY